MEKITSMNIYGVSRIEERDVLSLSASVDANGGYSITKSVYDREAYTSHKEECDADVAAFEKRVVSVFAAE